jgi:hypothetical protein
MKPLTPVKYGCLGIAAFAAYPFAVLAKDIGTLVVKYPRAMLAAAATAGIIAYSCNDIQRISVDAYHHGSDAVQQYHMRQTAKQEHIDRRIAAIVLRNQRLAKSLAQERSENAQLEARSAYHERALQQALESKETMQRLLTAQHIAPPSSPGAAFLPPHSPPPPPQKQYFLVNIGETLEQISQELTGSPSSAPLIARENDIVDERKLLAGQILQLPAALPTKQHHRLLATQPQLRSIVLQGDKSITDLCGNNSQCTTEVLSLNQQLGLRYTDRFPYRQGARVVYFR